jgi:activator of HSP90 ATPase
MHAVIAGMTRLFLIAGLAGVAFAVAQEATPKAAAIHEEIDFRVPPHRVYEALLDAKQFSAFSGLPAEIDRHAGGTFSLFGGAISGRNIELVTDKRVVQAWRSGWPEGVYSIVKFELTAQGSGTRLVFDHTGFPPDARDHLVGGWHEHYWEPLKKYFSQ